MAVTDYKIDKFSETVTGMPDNPTMEGWSAQRIKERFDSSAEELRVSLNGLIDHINARDETIENKVDKQEGMDLSENNFTDEYMALVDTIGYKADRDNVIEKDSTVVFMPTEDAHPASKKYVDKKVNEKIMEIGSSDMTQAVYDPTGRQTDIFAEVDKKANNDEHQLKSYYGLNGLGLSNDDFNATDFTATVSTILNIMPNGSLFAIACSTNTAPNLISCISNKIESDLGITYGIVQATVIVKKWNNTAMPSEIEVI